MVRKYILLLAAVAVIGCGKEKQETEDTVPEMKALAFTNKNYEKKTSLPCQDKCTHVSISIPLAESATVPADSINNKIFNTVRSIVYFGEKPTDGKTYEEVMNSFVSSYEELKKKFPADPMPAWEAVIRGSVPYISDSIINVKLNNYTFTGGAHGYEGDRSLLFNAVTGKSLEYKDIFKDEATFKAHAEKKFREKFKIPAGKPINSTGLMFEDEAFALPQNIFFTDKGLLLYYNAYEIASYAEQQKELLIPYSEATPFLKMK